MEENSRKSAGGGLFGPARLDEPPPDLQTLRPGDRFRLSFVTQFKTTAPFHLFVLQAEGGLWDALPVKQGGYVTELKDHAGKAVTVPLGAVKWYIVDEKARRVIEFVAVAVQAPLPSELRAAIEQGSAIEGARLDRLAYFLGELDTKKVRAVRTQRYVPGAGEIG